MPDNTETSRSATRLALVVCAVVLAIYAALAWSAVRGKSPTADEPVHALAGWLWLHQRDYRIDIEDPPLWGYWMALPNGRSSLSIDQDDPAWGAIPSTHWTANNWWRRTLFATTGNDAEALVGRSRAMALCLAVALGAAISWAALRMGGPVAAIAACLLYALDPNFLGHGPLVKNDVAITLIFLFIVLTLWRIGMRLTWWNAVLLGALCGVAMSVKFSGLIALPIVAVVGIWRALQSQAWLCLGHALSQRGRRLVVAVALVVWCMLAGAAVVWLSYGFRYAATPDGSPLNMRLQVALAAKARLLADDPSRKLTPEDLAAAPRGLLPSVALRLNEHRLMPEAWLNGLVYTYHTSIIRPGYLLDDVRRTGWWYYFPLAMLFKTPTATLLAIVLLALTSFGSWRSWTAVCLVVPAAMYLLTAMTTNLNLGLRHAFPIYPLLFVAIGVALARNWQARPRASAIVAGLLLMALATESLIAWPNYIAFFNTPAGGARGGIRLLGDSNLDWGQDLPALRRWQAQNPDTPIHLHYFGTVDPSRYVHATPFDPAANQWPGPGAVVAVSASHLQGIYLSPAARAFYDRLRRQAPLEVLNGTIYLYAAPPAPAAVASSPALR